MIFLSRKLGKESNLRVLWKWGGEMEGRPENVMLRDWLPQQDVLGEFIIISHKLFLKDAVLLKGNSYKQNKNKLCSKISGRELEKEQEHLIDSEI